MARAMALIIIPRPSVPMPVLAGKTGPWKPSGGRPTRKRMSSKKSVRARFSSL